MKLCRTNGLRLLVMLLVLDACAFAQTQPQSTPSDLVGTAWQLVKFAGSDDQTLIPDDKAKYTISFATDGRLTTRIDCNRGHGTWTSSGPSQLQFGPLAMTRALCPPGSLHDRIVKDWSYVRSYVIKDGHLFLSLMADGGVYEFEPTTATTPAAPRSPVSWKGRVFVEREDRSPIHGTVGPL